MKIGIWEEREGEKDTCILIKMKKVVGHSNKGEGTKIEKTKKVRPT